MKQIKGMTALAVIAVLGYVLWGDPVNWAMVGAAAMIGYTLVTLAPREGR